MDAVRELRDQVDELVRRVLASEDAQSPALGAVHPKYTESARNLAHYVALRQQDLRPLQHALSRQGLSSLGRLEGHALDALLRVRERLDDALARQGKNDASPVSRRALGGDEAEQVLHRHTRELLGKRPRDRHVYIMVTAPSALEVDEAWAEAVLHAGMNVLRINGAHEREEEWRRVVDVVRRAAIRLGVECRVVVDLPGPKLRTVALGEGTRVVRWRPERDELGRVTTPCTVRLRPASRPGPIEGPVMSVPDGVLAELDLGDRLQFRDARNKKREIIVSAKVGEDGLAAGELGSTAYVVPGLEVERRHKRSPAAWRVEIGDVPPQPFRVTLGPEDSLRLVRPGSAAVDPEVPSLGCTLEAALLALRPGHRVIFDDGKLHAVVERVDERGALLRMTAVPGGEGHLGGEKGINLPDSEITLPFLAEDDERALAWAVRHADVVEASFVRGADDVRTLHRRLVELGGEGLGVVLKIETGPAFARLPAILLAAMERYPTGIMIARGDLAIEAGFERLAELQEEILWLCEAAHLPAIWATQVLDGMAHSGQASRAEVTDAAMAVRAECAMLNKGPYVVEATRALANILRRMEQHQYKKRTLHRRLHIELPSPP